MDKTENQQLASPNIFCLLLCTRYVRRTLTV